MAFSASSLAASTLARATGRLSRKSSALFICDMQKRFEPVMPNMDVLLRKSVMMVNAAAELGIPVVVTEQTPDKLLSTSDVLLDAIPAGTRIFEKSSFSMITSKVNDYLARDLSHVKSVILCGIEAHICVTQTALDLIDRGYDVHLVADACSSQRESDRQIAFQRVSQSGGFLTTPELVLFELTKDSQDPSFRTISKLAKREAEHMKRELEEHRPS